MRFETTKKLGEGSEGSVLISTDNTNKQISIKLFNKHHDKRNNQIDGFNNVKPLDIWIKMNDEMNVIACKGICEKKNISTNESKGNKDKYAVVMECMDTDLRKYMRKNKLTTEQEKLIVRSCIKALYYLHINNIVHGDIKHENILINESLTEVKICDFGHSFYYCEKFKEKHKYISTEGFRAPEVLSYSYIPKSDIFSLGMVFLSFFQDDHTVEGKTQEELDEILRKIKSQIILEKKVISILKKSPCHFSPDFSCVEKSLHGIVKSLQNDNKDDFFRIINANPPVSKFGKQLISKILNVIERKYDKINQRKLNKLKQENDFKMELLSLLRGMLKYNHEERFTSEKCLRHPAASRDLDDLKYYLIPKIEIHPYNFGDLLPEAKSLLERSDDDTYTRIYFLGFDLFARILWNKYLPKTNKELILRICCYISEKFYLGSESSFFTDNKDKQFKTKYSYIEHQIFTKLKYFIYSETLFEHTKFDKMKIFELLSSITEPEDIYSLAKKLN